jgi:hypothetical protein
MRVNNLRTIIKDQFFKNFIWEDLISFKMKAPYIPETKSYSAFITKNSQPLEYMLKSTHSEKDSIYNSLELDPIDSGLNNDNWCEDF